MEILVISAYVLVTLGITAWHLGLSPTARSTRELAYLNKIAKPFADKKKTPQVFLRELQSKRWKYHQEKADLYITICEQMA